MEMFVLRYVNLPHSVCSPKWPNLLTKVLFPNLCKRNYLCGNLPFYKIHANRFMARDELSGAILNFKTFLSFY